MTLKRTTIFKNVCNQIYNNINFLVAFPQVYLALDPLQRLIVVNGADCKVIKSFDEYKFRGREEYNEKLLPALKSLGITEK